MKNTYLTILAVMFFIQLNAQFAQNVFGIGGTGYDGITCVMPDPNGGWLVSGYFQNTIDLDPNETVYELTVATGTYGRFVCKYNNNFQPLQSAVFPAAMFVASINQDADQNIYIAGSLSGNFSVDADPGVGVQLITPEGSGDVFLCKLNSDLEFLWALTIGANNEDVLKEMAISPDGNIVLAMSTTSLIELNTINGVQTFDATFTFGVPFIVSVDSDGAINWGALFAGTPYLATYQPMDVDSQGNIYFAGSYEYTMDADPGEGVYTLELIDGSWENFIIKLNPSGELVWAYAFGNPPYDSDYSFAIEVSPNDIVSFTGRGLGQFDIDPTEGEYIITNPQGVGYVLNLSAAGEFIDVWEFTGGNFITINEIHYDEAGNCYCLLPCTSSCDLNPGEETLSGLGTFIVKMGPDGNFVSSYSLPTQGILVSDISSDANDNLIINGTLFGQSGATFQTVNGDISVPNNGQEDIFLLLASPCENSGCLDNTACNFDAEALCESGVCIYAEATDFDCNGAIGVGDLLIMLAEFGCMSDCGDFDIDQDGIVGATDLVVLIGNM